MEFETSTNNFQKEITKQENRIHEVLEKLNIEEIIELANLLLKLDITATTNEIDVSTLSQEILEKLGSLIKLIPMTNTELKVQTNSSPLNLQSPRKKALIANRKLTNGTDTEKKPTLNQTRRHQRDAWKKRKNAQETKPFLTGNRKIRIITAWLQIKIAKINQSASAKIIESTDVP